MMISLDQVRPRHGAAPASLPYSHPVRPVRFCGAKAGTMPEGESEPDSGTARKRPRLLICLLVAAVAAGLGVVAAVTLTRHDDPAAASTRLDQARVEREVTPGLVDTRANLQYSHELPADTGII